MAAETHVIFGTGPVGLAAMDALIARGDVNLRLVNRSGRRDGIPQDVELLNGDASDPDFTRQAAQGADAVYFALNPPYTQWPTLFPPLQAAVVDAAIHSGARFVAMENAYAYGDTDGAPLTEDLPLQATTRKGAVRAAMTRDLLAAHQAGRVRVVIARASDFVGPRVTQSQLGDRVFPNALAGKAAQVFGDVDQAHTYTYMPDIGQALATLGTADPDSAVYGRAWHVPAAPTISTRQWLEKIYAESGQDAVKVSTMPRLMVRGLSLFVPVLREIYELLYEFEKPFILDSSAFTARFGQTGTPVDTVVRETVAWYRQQG